jgi:Tol biopolymer transport system component
VPPLAVALAAGVALTGSGLPGAVLPGAVRPAAADAAAIRNGPLALVSAGRVVLQPLGGAPRIVGDSPASILGSSRDGRLVASSSGLDGDVTIADRHGRVVRRFAFRGIVVHSLDVSPDGSALALTAYRDAEPVPGRIYPYTARIDGKALRRLNTQARYAYDLRFDRDGRTLVYAAAPSSGPLTGCASLRRVRADGTAEGPLYLATGGARPCVVNLSLSPGGHAAAFTGDPAPGTASDPAAPRTAVYRVPLGGTATPQLLRRASYAVAWAPAGDQLAFSGNDGTFRASSHGGTPVRVSALATLSLTWLRAVG